MDPLYPLLVTTTNVAPIIILALCCAAVMIFWSKLHAHTLHTGSALMAIGATVIVTPNAVFNLWPPFDSLEVFGLSAIQLSTSISSMLGALLFLGGLFNLIYKCLPKINTEVQRLEKKSKLFKQSYRQLKDDLEHRDTQLTKAKNEISKLKDKEGKNQFFGSSSIDLYRKIFDSSPVFYISLTDSDAINDINTYSCNRLKYAFDDLVGARFLDIVAPDERHRIGLLLNTLRSNKQCDLEFETELRDRDLNTIAVTVKVQSIQRGDFRTNYLFCLDVSESKELSNTLAFQALHDDLTELLNRRALEKYFNNRASLQSKGNLLAIIYFDVDQLKVVNDTCGHTAGDQLLKQLVAILKPVCENYKCNTFARIGGDEFAIIVTNLNREAIALFAESLRSTAEDLTFTWDSKSFRQSISVGVAISNKNTIGLKELLSTADAACYSAKENGRNQVRVNNVDETNNQSDHRQGMLWVARLDQAIKQGNFVLNFQPIVQITKPRSNYIHYEVLLQYIDEKGRKVPPGNFLPSAERFGKSTEIDLWVITETFDFLRRNPEHTRQLSSCSINLTSHSIANHRAREAIISLVRAHNFPEGKVCFEITETSAISNLAEAIAFIKTLRSLGCRFALDDFGTGFSSFGYLKNLDVDYLKIDGSFVKGIGENKIDRAMVRAISEIAKAMGIKTIAEYVENDVIMRELNSIGVNFGQGFGIAKPMPIEAIHEHYHSAQQDSIG